ncbi:hypothetical protein BDV30DRAFT_204591 [Aspergillus minisclerotigenes]|uniref:HNH nuclease domain-containing protein n=1 Tax=Aspergillus minisclerotigenes TaxID=656917 RepID=A0A5N6JJN3_9EURO|nr:hypothetical protein BDV30DRAFT_204591 [Aspergillus minisclerotigenes]
MLPPPAQGNPPSSTSSSSLGKRKRENKTSVPRTSSVRRASSNGSTAFSASTREQVKSLESLDNGDVCWHCAATPTDVCHVITKADREFETYRIRGLVNIDSPSHVDNGIPLCALCHRNFNDCTTHVNDGLYGVCFIRGLDKAAATIGTISRLILSPGRNLYALSAYAPDSRLTRIRFRRHNLSLLHGPGHCI